MAPERPPVGADQTRLLLAARQVEYQGGKNTYSTHVFISEY